MGFRWLWEGMRVQGRRLYGMVPRLQAVLWRPYGVRVMQSSKAMAACPYRGEKDALTWRGQGARLGGDCRNATEETEYGAVEAGAATV